MAASRASGAVPAPSLDGDRLGERERTVTSYSRRTRDDRGPLDSTDVPSRVSSARRPGPLGQISTFRRNRCPAGVREGAERRQRPFSGETTTIARVTTQRTRETSLRELARFGTARAINMPPGPRSRNRNRDSGTLAVILLGSLFLADKRTRACMYTRAYTHTYTRTHVYTNTQLSYSVFFPCSR